MRTLFLHLLVQLLLLTWLKMLLAGTSLLQVNFLICL
ncbi:Uncharacterised protein [Mycobacterium tuberculosis]|nr:Uncharacterised protein [Mycobacterium tuberculosis]